VNQATFDAVDAFVGATLLSEDAELAAALRAAEEAGLPPIQVSPPQGRMLQILARLQGAKKMLEFGTLGGYSSILLARVLPAGGKLITLEYDPKHAAVAAANFERAGVADRIDLRVGAALDTLPELEDEGPFDLVFIDADKINTPNYFAWSLDHSRPGSLIIADNVVRDGTLADPDAEPPSQAQRHLHEMLADEPRVTATTIQTVGSKGYDGFTLALVEG
jgi:predicted O-methyltransferase YrrM